MDRREWRLAVAAVDLAWLTAARDELAKQTWPERLDGPDGFVTVTYASAPGDGMVATLHGWDADASAYKLEIGPDITVPLDQVQISLSSHGGTKPVEPDQ